MGIWDTFSLERAWSPRLVCRTGGRSRKRDSVRHVLRSERNEIVRHTVDLVLNFRRVRKPIPVESYVSTVPHYLFFKRTGMRSVYYIDSEEEFRWVPKLYNKQSWTKISQSSSSRKAPRSNFLPDFCKQGPHSLLLAIEDTGISPIPQFPSDEDDKRALPLLWNTRCLSQKRPPVSHHFVLRPCVWCHVI